jgi:hypothetical protein
VSGVGSSVNMSGVIFSPGNSCAAPASQDCGTTGGAACFTQPERRGSSQGRKEPGYIRTFSGTGHKLEGDQVWATDGSRRARSLLLAAVAIMEVCRLSIAGPLIQQRKKGAGLDTRAPNPACRLDESTVSPSVTKLLGRD